MADITPLIGSDQQVIQSYGPQGFKVSGKTYDGPVIVMPNRTQSWTAREFSSLAEADFMLFLHDDPPDVVLLGCGARMALPPPSVRALLRTRAIALEPMDTGAACRTYNVLMAEGRRVAAALLPPV